MRDMALLTCLAVQIVECLEVACPARPAAKGEFIVEAFRPRYRSSQYAVLAAELQTVSYKCVSMKTLVP